MSARPRWRERALGWLAAVALRALGATWRIETRGVNPVGVSGRLAEVGAIWHRDVLVTAYYFRGTGFSVPVSRSRDGEIIASVLGPLGYADPPRGSSSRGGAAALRGLVRMVRGGTTVAIPTDGPRGPARSPKPGVLMLARLTGTPITPVAFASRPRLRFRSWDRTHLPVPFARVLCAFGNPIEVPRDADSETLAALGERLGREHNRLTDELDRELAVRP